MKRKFIFSLIAIGLFLQVWMGSYWLFRESGPATFTIGNGGLCRTVQIPEWVEPFRAIYLPLARIDSAMSGVQTLVSFGDPGFRFTIGYEF